MYTQLQSIMYTISKKYTTKYFKIYLVKCLIYSYKLTLPSVSGGWSGENFLGWCCYWYLSNRLSDFSQKISQIVKTNKTIHRKLLVFLFLHPNPSN